MKNSLTIIVFLLISASITAQTYAVNYTSVNEVKKTKERNTISHFHKNLETEGSFKYRDFLRVSKNSKVVYKTSYEYYTQADLAKIFRKAARYAENQEEFEKSLNNENPELTINLTKKEKSLLFEKFRQGTFHQYIHDLADDWQSFKN
tara:strand:+ start:338 stop:781 length:444 start_codon:yes stop_codon:yes gene_type:complete